MKSKLKLIKLFFIAIALSGYLGLVLPQVSHAATPGPSNPSSINSLFQGQICAPDDTDGGSQYNIARCVNNIYLFAIIIGSFIAVGMFVVAGYSYAMGTHEDISRAKSIINSTIIGLVLLFGTYAFLNTIDENLTKIPSLSVSDPECVEQTITYKDKDQNTKTLVTNSCANEEEQQRLIDQGMQIIESQIITQEDRKATTSAAEGGSIANTFGGRFKQEASPWGSQIYTQKNGQPCGDPKQSTVGTSGCGPSALANVIYAYKQTAGANIVPDQVIKDILGSEAENINPGNIAKVSSALGFRVCGSGTSYQMFNEVAKHYGMRSQPNLTWEQTEKLLRNKIPVIAAMGPGYFTSNGHFIVLYGIEGDKVLISDSGPRDRTIASINTVKNEAKYMVSVNVPTR